MIATRTTILLTAACVITGGTTAAPVAVINHDFEDDAATDAQILTPAGGATGWTYSGAGNPGVFNPSAEQSHYTGLGGAATIGTMDGPTFGFHFPDDGNTGESSQELLATLGANTTYTLTVAIGTRNYFNAGQVPSDFRIALETTGGTVVAEFIGDVINGNTNTPGENTTGTITPTESSFLDYVASGSTAAVAPAGEGEALVIKIQSLSDGRYLDFDNVRVDASPVPEPSSLALLGLGGLAMLRRRRG